MGMSSSRSRSAARGDMATERQHLGNRVSPPLTFSVTERAAGRDKVNRT